MEVRFAQSARKHRIGRARVLRVIQDPTVFVELPGPEGSDDRLVFLGDDGTGRVLEVMGVRIQGGILIIHVMDIRPKWRDLYKEGRNVEEVNDEG